MKTLDRVFGWLMALGGVGHGLGSYRAYSHQPMSLLWALSASFAVFLLAAVNLARAGRKGDRTLAWISFGGCVVWIGFVLWFGLLIGNVFDFRPLVNAVIALVLAIFSLRSAIQST
jgi:hypothetical protein